MLQALLAVSFFHEENDNLGQKFQEEAANNGIRLKDTLDLAITVGEDTKPCSRTGIWLGSIELFEAFTFADSNPVPLFQFP